MAVWSAKRKFLYLGIVAGILLVWFLVFVLPNLQNPPSCIDGIQNGKESGIDCGGNCPRYCSTQALDLTTRWSRVFRVVPGRYNAIAMVENQNATAAISEIDYEFRLYDEENVFVGRRTGSTYITPNNRTAIFEPGILTGSRVPIRTDFTFTETPLWLQTPRDFVDSFSVATSNIRMQNPFTNPTLTATIKNNSQFDIFDFDVIAVLYNQENNVLAVSQTFVEELDQNAEYTVFFTWQDSFVEDPVRIEILPQVNVFGQAVYNN